MTMKRFFSRLALVAFLVVPVVALSSAGAAPVSALPDVSLLTPFTTFGNSYNFNLTTIKGDIGLSKNGTFLAPNGQISGKAFLDTGVSKNIGAPSHISAGIVQPTDLSAAQAEVFSASNTLKSLAPDYNLANVTTAQTFNATGPVTVIDMNSLSLGGSANITFNGDPSDFFVLNIAHGLSLTGSSIIGAGGDPSHILINLYDNSGNLGTAAHVGNILNGSVLIPFDAATFHSMNGAIWSGNGEITLMSGATVTNIPFVPEASTNILLLVGVSVLGLSVAKRKLSV
jgi:choice-of-anchor A domain-containing protein